MSTTAEQKRRLWATQNYLNKLAKNTPDLKCRRALNEASLAVGLAYQSLNRLEIEAFVDDDNPSGTALIV
jgi:hypothetical protein